MANKNDFKIEFIVMMTTNHGDEVVDDVGNKGRFDNYEGAEKACKDKAGWISADTMGGFPDYWIKKVFTK